MTESNHEPLGNEDPNSASEEQCREFCEQFSGYVTWRIEQFFFPRRIDNSDLEDLSQEVLFSVFRKYIQRSVPIPKPFGLLKKVARRKCLDFRREQDRRPRLHSLAQETLDSKPIAPPREARATANKARADELLDALPHMQRTVVILRVFCEWTFDKIAASMEVTENKATTLYKQALCNLQARKGDF